MHECIFCIVPSTPLVTGEINYWWGINGMVSTTFTLHFSFMPAVYHLWSTSLRTLRFRCKKKIATKWISQEGTGMAAVREVGRKGRVYNLSHLIRTTGEWTVQRCPWRLLPNRPLLPILLLTHTTQLAQAASSRDQKTWVMTKEEGQITNAADKGQVGQKLHFAQYKILSLSKLNISLRYNRLYSPF